MLDIKLKYTSTHLKSPSTHLKSKFNAMNLDGIRYVNHFTIQHNPNPMKIIINTEIMGADKSKKMVDVKGVDVGKKMEIKEESGNTVDNLSFFSSFKKLGMEITKLGKRKGKHMDVDNKGKLVNLEQEKKGMDDSGLVNVEQERKELDDSGLVHVGQERKELDDSGVVNVEQEKRMYRWVRKGRIRERMQTENKGDQYIRMQKEKQGDTK